MAEKNPFEIEPATVGHERNPFLEPEQNPFLDNRNFFERMMHGDAVGRILSEAGSKAAEGFGDGKLGFQEGSDATQAMRAIGAFTDPEHPRILDPIRAISEFMLKGGAAIGDLGLRGLEAGIYGSGGAIKQSLIETGLNGEGWATRAQDEWINAWNAAMTGMQGVRPGGLARARVRITRVGNEVLSENIGELPKNPDFQVAGRAMHMMGGGDGVAYDHTTNKLKALWEEHGLHPAEVLADANADKGLAKDLASTSPMLPERYTGFDALKKLRLDAINEGRFQNIEGISPELNAALQERITWPDSNIRGSGAATIDAPEPGLRMRFGIHAGMLLDRVGFGIPSVLRDAGLTFTHGMQMQFTPMALRLANIETRAAAKDFATMGRVALFDGQYIDRLLEKEFTPAERAKMFDAIDAEDAARMRGEKVSPPEGLASLDPRQRGVANQLRRRMMRTYREAGQMDMHRDTGKEPSLEGVHRDSPEFLKLTEFRQFVKKGLLGPAEPHNAAAYLKATGGAFKRIDRGLGVTENMSEAEALKMAARIPERRGSFPGIDTGLALGYRTEDIARYIAHNYALKNEMGFKEKEQAAHDAGKEPPMPSAASVRGAYRLMKGGPSGLGREYYVPRMLGGIAEITKPGVSNIDELGRNLRDRTAQLMRRFYTFSSDTEQAAKLALGEQAFLVRDIRTLNLANMKLQQAMAGRKLVDAIEQLSAVSGEKTVVPRSELPTHKEREFFTIDHPALRTVEPMLARDESGRFARVTKPDGTPAWRSEQIMIHRTFEGPLRAVLSTPDWSVYRGLMMMKAKAMSYIMFSPLMHNMVIAGRAFPAVNGSLPGLTRLYSDGMAVKKDPIAMRHAIANGLVPIGKWGTRFDLDSITLEGGIEPGQSLEAKIIGFIPNLFSKEKGDATKRAIDKAGDFYHNALLWNRVGDLQMGLYKNYFTELRDRGVNPDVAAKAASHLANRYAGVLPPEAMSNMARRIANVLLFSRSYTLGNIGSMKDMFTGLPRDVLAQIERDEGVKQMLAIQSWARRKAIGIVAVDIALFYAGNAILENVLDLLRAEKPGDKMQEDAQDYIDRLQKYFKYKFTNPWSVLNVPGIPSAIQSLLPGGEHEPGKEDRALIGYQSDGTAMYLKNPTGKTGEDMLHWVTQFRETAWNKMNPQVKAVGEALANRDYAGHMLYSPNLNTPQKQLDAVKAVVWNAMKSFAPADWIDAWWDLLHGTPTSDEKTVDIWKIVGPMMGVMVSRGFPGGPAGGFLHQAKAEQHFREQQMFPEIRKDIKEGRLEDATNKMISLGMDGRYQKWLIDVTLNPSASFVKKRTLQFMSTLPAEDQERWNKMLQENHR